MLKVAKLLPGRGLDATYVDDRVLEAGGQGMPMRGCDNIRLVDAEWWIREGELVRQWKLLSLPCEVAVSIDLMYGNTQTRRHFLLGRPGVLEVDVEAGTYAISVPYNTSWAGSVSFIQGSRVVTVLSTSSGSTTDAHIIYGLNESNVQTVYYTTSRSATQFILDREYAGPTNTVGYSTSGFVSTTDSTTLTRRSVNRVSFAVFRQRVAYSSGDIWGGAGAATVPWRIDKSPAITAGSVWLVWCPGVAATAGVTGPCAVRLDATANLAASFMRQTSANYNVATGSDATAFNNNDQPFYVTTYGDRLIVSRADESNVNDDRTIWYSRPGDMMLWHTGTAGGTPAATNNLIRFTDGMDPITGMASLNDSLIIHRRRSQQVLRLTGAETFPPGPFQIQRNDQGIGCVANRTIVNVRGTHYFMSEYGPMMFDGQRVLPLHDGLMRVARQVGVTAEFNSDTAWPQSLHAIYHAARQEIWWSLGDVYTFDNWAEAGESDEYTQRYLVFNITTGECSLTRYMDGYSGGTFASKSGGVEWVARIRSDGSMCQSTQAGRARDSGVNADADRVTPPCYFETPWLTFGSELEKTITRVEIETRAFADEADYQNDLVSDVSFGGSNAFRYTLQVHTDLDMASMPVDMTFNVEKERLSELTTLSEGTRGTPRVLVIPKMRVQGNSFKFRLKNTGVSVWRPLRVSQIVVHYEEGTSYRRERVP